MTFFDVVVVFFFFFIYIYMGCFAPTLTFLNLINHHVFVGLSCINNWDVQFFLSWSFICCDSLWTFLCFCWFVCFLMVWTRTPYSCSCTTHLSELAQWLSSDRERNRSWPSASHTCNNFVWCAAHGVVVCNCKAGFVIIEKVTQGMWEMGPKFVGFYKVA